MDIAAAIAEGLSAAHAKGVIHRDLKPENLFLTRDGTVKILDFGLAAQRMPFGSAERTMPAVTPTAAGVVLGTFGYMSPEQVMGQPVDGRSDVFALGCVLYEMLTARRLFDGVTPQEVIANVLRDSSPELAAFDPQAPAQLRLIVARAVERPISRRFESAREFAVALRALLTGSGSGILLRTGARIRGKSLAVLPFLSPGGNQQIEYLTDGITESIINSLSQVANLRVVPRSLTFRYKGVEVDPATVGLALNVRTILTGRVIQQGDLLNIQAELVDTGNQSQLWGEQFRKKVSDLMAVQEEIAWQISEALRLKLTGQQRKRLKKRATVKPDAYDEYLRGRYHWNSWSADGFRRSLDHFERAIAIDPLYARGVGGAGRFVLRDGVLRHGAARRPISEGAGCGAQSDRARRRARRPARHPGSLCALLGMELAGGDPGVRKGHRPQSAAGARAPALRAGLFNARQARRGVAPRPSGAGCSSRCRQS